MENIQQYLVTSLNDVNREINSTQEMVLAAMDNNGSGVKILTELSFRDQCDNATCAYNLPEAPFLAAAAEECRKGMSKGIDYRGMPVTVGYHCIPELKLGLIMKVDQNQIDSGGLELAIEYVNNWNRLHVDTSEEILLVTHNQTPNHHHNATAAPHKSLVVLTAHHSNHQQECSHSSCASDMAAPGEPLLSALLQSQGTMQGVFDGEHLLAASDYIHQLGVAIVVKVHSSPRACVRSTIVSRCLGTQVCMPQFKWVRILFSHACNVVSPPFVACTMASCQIPHLWRHAKIPRLFRVGFFIQYRVQYQAHGSIRRFIFAALNPRRVSIDVQMRSCAREHCFRG